MTANPYSKPNNLGCESAENCLLPSAFTIAVCYYYRPMEAERLSRPWHCSKGLQPVPKAVYRSGCRDKHNRPRWDSNLGPLTPQWGAIATRPLRLIAYCGVAQSLCYTRAFGDHSLAHAYDARALCSPFQKPDLDYLLYIKMSPTHHIWSRYAENWPCLYNCIRNRATNTYVQIHF